MCKLLIASLASKPGITLRCEERKTDPLKCSFFKTTKASQSAYNFSPKLRGMKYLITYKRKPLRGGTVSPLFSVFLSI